VPTIALAQAATIYGPRGRDENVANAYRYAKEAALRGADLVCFPESYPGPWRMPVTWSPVAELRKMAREIGIYIIGGYAEPLDDEGCRCHNNLVLVSPDGTEVGLYRRTTPAHAPWIYKGGDYWDFDWVPAKELPVFETDIGKVGLLICSEVYAPELARILALKGAELVFIPAGLMGSTTSLTATWRTLIWARAIENLMCTAICSNVVSEGEQGLAMICTPEEILLESRAEGVHVAAVDLERIRWLRAEQDRLVDEPEPWRTKPGTLRDWRRQEVFEANPVLVRAEQAPPENGRRSASPAAAPKPKRRTPAAGTGS
jgi:predicted amidohydrolase